MENNKKFKLNGRTLSYMVNGLILVSLIGLFQWMTAGFDPTVFMTSSFYITMGYRVAVSAITLNLVLNILRDMNISKNTVFIYLVKKYNLLISRKDKDFPSHIDNLNDKRKHKKYREDIEKLIFKLERKQNKTRSIKKKDKLEKTIRELKSVDFTNLDLSNVRVNYDKIYEGFFSVSSLTLDNNSEALTGNFNAEKANVGIKNIITSMVTFGIVSAMGINFVASNDSIGLLLFNLLFDLFIIATATIKAFLSFDKIFTKSTISPIEKKIDIMVDYLSIKTGKSYININTAIDTQLTGESHPLTEIAIVKEIKIDKIQQDEIIEKE